MTDDIHLMRPQAMAVIAMARSIGDRVASSSSVRVGLIVAGLAILLTSCTGSPGLHSKSLLVVGDSVAGQAAEALIHLAPEGTTVTVDAAKEGTAPCDWNHGFTDPTDGDFRKFSTIFDRIHPSLVVFVFTGNPGMSGTGAGCLDAKSHYDLSQLLASYETSLVPMAEMAAAAGSVVYYEAPPPRNPAVPVGYDSQVNRNRGFNGSPQLASFYENLATRNPRHWRYDDSAAVAVSTSDLSWRLTLPCEVWDAKVCTNGEVPVRVGGVDPIHLDQPGCGGIRFGLAVEERVFGTSAPNAMAVAAVVSDYGGCQ